MHIRQSRAVNLFLFLLLTVQFIRLLGGEHGFWRVLNLSGSKVSVILLLNIVAFC